MEWALIIFVTGMLSGMSTAGIYTPVLYPTEERCKTQKEELIRMDALIEPGINKPMHFIFCVKVTRSK